MASNTLETSISTPRLDQINLIELIIPNFRDNYLGIQSSSKDLAETLMKSLRKESEINAYDLALRQQSVQAQTAQLVRLMVACLERQEPNAQIKALDAIYTLLENESGMTNYRLRCQLDAAMKENAHLIDLTQQTNASVASALFVN